MTESKAASSEESIFPDGLIDDFKKRLSESQTQQKQTLSQKDHDSLVESYFNISPEVQKSVVHARRTMLGACARVAADDLLDNISKSESPTEETAELVMHTGTEKVSARAQAQRTTRTPNTGELHHAPSVQLTHNVPNALQTSCTSGLKEEIQKAVDAQLEK